MHHDGIRADDVHTGTAQNPYDERSNISELAVLRVGKSIVSADHDLTRDGHWISLPPALPEPPRRASAALLAAVVRPKGPAASPLFLDSPAGFLWLPANCCIAHPLGLFRLAAGRLHRPARASPAPTGVTGPSGGPTGAVQF